MVFGRNRNHRTILTIQGNGIYLAHSTKFIGVIIDDKLNWNKLVTLSVSLENVYQSCIKQIGLHLETLQCCTIPLFQPYRNYCSRGLCKYI